MVQDLAGGLVRRFDGICELSGKARDTSGIGRSKIDLSILLPSDEARLCCGNIIRNRGIVRS
ncbi:MAG: hypothetical protein V4595_06885 [Pseudomonadota bacterium]|jgi:hypothetical protein